jgi:nicotinamide mononucleotide (NMN) deamidase PncC
MDSNANLLIEALHRAPGKCVLALTGGGAGAAAMLLGVPGASRTILEAAVPYSETALAEFLGHRPEQFCSAATSKEMAGRAYSRARWLDPTEPVYGVGCTGSLATDRPKRGEHRFHVAVTGVGTVTYSLTLHKGGRDRAGEETVLDAVLLNALAAAFGIEERLTPALLPGEAVEVESEPAASPLAAFLRGETAAVCIEPDGQVRKNSLRPAVLVPGAFNPLHVGHRALAAAAGQLTSRPAAFELSVVNVDKPPLPAEEIRRRFAQFAWTGPVWLTRAPTFIEKAALFPGVVFAVGADTAARVVAPRYYGDNEVALAAALDAIRRHGCRFLVAGRADERGVYLRLEGLAIPPAFRDLFTPIPEDLFRMDLSSTQLRRQKILPSPA